MIDARRFATAYNSFWQYAAPTLDLFVRRANLDGYRRWDAPLEKAAAGDRQALVAEFAFSEFLVERGIENGIIADMPDHEKYARVWSEAKGALRPYAAQGLDVETELTEDERGYGRRLTQRLSRFFANRPDILTMRPCFPGCGYIDMSVGDLMAGSTLFEVKSVDRMMRGIDLRQLLTYAALNSSAKKFDLAKIGIVNPRRGISAEFDLEEICLGISGKHADTLLTEIIETVSSGEMSR